MKQAIPKVTVGIPAFNEEKDIGMVLRAILRQTGSFVVQDIFVVSDDCRDRTDEIVGSFQKETSLIKLIRRAKRHGKMSAINKILALSKTRYVVIANADNIPSDDAIACLFSQMTAGVALVGPQAICSKSDKPKLSEKITELMWNLHHQIAMTNPKIVSFMLIDKQIIGEINTVCPVDEPLVEAEAVKQGATVRYAPEAKLFIKPPTKFRDYLSQRRRIHYGYYLMRKYYPEYAPPTMDFNLLLPFLKKEFRHSPYILMSAAVCEFYAKILGYADFLRGKENSAVWDTAESSKGL